MLSKQQTHGKHLAKLWSSPDLSGPHACCITQVPLCASQDSSSTLNTWSNLGQTLTCQDPAPAALRRCRFRFSSSPISTNIGCPRTTSVDTSAVITWSNIWSNPHLPGSCSCCVAQVPLQVLQQPAQHKHGLASHHLLPEVEDEGLVNLCCLAQCLCMALQQQTAAAFQKGEVRTSGAPSCMR